jgi:hypothetical protein
MQDLKLSKQCFRLNRLHEFDPISSNLFHNILLGLADDCFKHNKTLGLNE